MTAITTRLVVSEHHWNTGNGYTVAGQRIGALLLDDGSLVFADIDRNIDGFISADFMEGLTPREGVEYGYMHSGYHYWQAADDMPWQEADRLKKRAQYVAHRAAPKGEKA